MIRSEKLYRYAAEFIECELKTIDRALMRTDSEERRDELQKRQHELICDLEDMEKQGYIGKSLEQVKRVKKTKGGEGMLNLEPKHEKKSRLERFFGDLLGAEKTIPRTECDWIDPRIPTDEELDKVVDEYLAIKHVSVPDSDLAFMD